VNFTILDAFLGVCSLAGVIGVVPCQVQGVDSTPVVGITGVLVGGLVGKKVSPDA
jgi:outer membrane lipoprotein SlyB